MKTNNNRHTLIFAVPLLALLLFSFIISFTSASVPITVELCSGTNCGLNRPARCKKEQLQSQTCYINKETGTATSFSCKRNESWACFAGKGFLDPFCRTESSRNSMRCGSCAGESSFQCNSFIGTVTEFSNCSVNNVNEAFCSNCSSELTLPTGRCEKDPRKEGGFWYKMEDIMPCTEIMLVAKHYLGNRCGERERFYEEAIPSRFCAAGYQAQESRRLICHGQDDEEDDDDDHGGYGVLDAEIARKIMRKL